MAYLAEEIMFIKDDDYILISEDQYGGRYTPDDLKRLRDIGVQTIIRYPMWKNIEPKLGEYVWDEIDESIHLTRSAGMKCLFAVYDQSPDYFPTEWYLKAVDGRDYIGPYQERLISPWSAEGWLYHIDFIKKFCDRVSADDVMCFRATTHGAESMFPQYYPYRQDGAYLTTMLLVLLEEQEVFYKAHPSYELWTCFHHAFDSLGTAGTEYTDELYRTMWERFPNAKHYCISYTQFRDDVKGEDENRKEMQELGLSMFGGAEYAEGLLTNTDRAISEGFRGLVCGAIHYFSGHKTMEDWMFDNFKYSINRWREAKRV